MKLEIKGVEELKKALSKKASLDDVKTVVKQNGAELQRKMQRNANFTKGYATGTTKRSISLEIRDGGLTAAIGPSTEYSPYLEYGTRFMSAQPFIHPAGNAQKAVFRNDMSKLLKKK